MPADITTILNAMKAALEAAYPTISVLVKAKPAHEPGKAPMPGWMPGDPCPAHVLSAIDAETPDESASFEQITLGYPVVLEAVFDAAPQPWDDNPDVRTRRVELEYLFYQNGVAGMPANAFDVRYKPLPVYAGNPEETVMISAQMFTYTINLPRPGV